MPKGITGTTEMSVLIVKRFPRSLRQQLHAQAALEAKRVGEVIVELIERGLTVSKKGGQR